MGKCDSQFKILSFEFWFFSELDKEQEPRSQEIKVQGTTRMGVGQEPLNYLLNLEGLTVSK